MTSMGVQSHSLPRWDDIQILTAQMATKPLMEDIPVTTETIIGPKAKKPLHLKIPLFVSDISFGALSEEAKTGTRGHLPANKNLGKISQVRNLPEGTDAISLPTFAVLKSVENFKNLTNKVRELSGGIPIGFKLSANHIEADIQFAFSVPL